MKKMKWFQKEKKARIRLKFRRRRKKPGGCPGSCSLSKHRMVAKDHGTLKSPRLRFLMKLDAERDVRVAPKSTCIYSSIQELFNNK